MKRFLAAPALARVNTVLLIFIILINGYIIAMPFVPAVIFWWQTKYSDKAAQLSSVLRKTPEKPPSSGSDNSGIDSTSAANRLIIPAILFDAPFYTGNSARELRKGAWLRPNGSTPDKGSNTVIAGHRFTYTNPQGAFYHLDKLRLNDEIGIFYNNVKYVYSVTGTRVVPAKAAHIEAPTGQPTLTLYTCTPLWKPKDRLVVTAKLLEPLLPPASHQEVPNVR